MGCTLQPITVSKCLYTFQNSLPNFSLLGMFTKFRKAIIGFLKSCLSEWNNLASPGRIFMKFDIWEFFENLLRKFKFHYNRTRTTGPLQAGQCTFMKISHWILDRMGNVEKIKIYILCSITFSWKYAIYEIMWKNMVEPDMPQVTI